MQNKLEVYDWYYYIKNWFIDFERTTLLNRTVYNDLRTQAQEGVVYLYSGYIDDVIWLNVILYDESFDMSAYFGFEITHDMTVQEIIDRINLEFDKEYTVIYLDYEETIPLTNIYQIYHNIGVFISGTVPRAISFYSENNEWYENQFYYLTTYEDFIQFLDLKKADFSASTYYVDLYDWSSTFVLTEELFDYLYENEAYISIFFETEDNSDKFLNVYVNDELSYILHLNDYSNIDAIYYTFDYLYRYFFNGIYLDSEFEIALDFEAFESFMADEEEVLDIYISKIENSVMLIFWDEYYYDVHYQMMNANYVINYLAIFDSFSEYYLDGIYYEPFDRNLIEAGMIIHVEMKAFRLDIYYPDMTLEDGPIFGVLPYDRTYTNFVNLMYYFDGAVVSNGIYLDEARTILLTEENYDAFVASFNYDNPVHPIFYGFDE